jgi:hypothetical protein
MSLGVHSFGRSHGAKQPGNLRVAFLIRLAGEGQQPMVRLRLTDESLV